MTITKSSKRVIATSLAILTCSVIGAAAATFTVTNTNDAGAGSLRQAVLDTQAAPGADTIVFDPAVFNVPRTITLASQIALSSGSQPIDDVTIVGPGPDLLTISGNDAVRHFTTQNGDTTSISGMTLTGGRAVAGGSINNVGMTTLTNIHFVQNTTTTGGGGAIYSGGNGTTGGILNIANCEFINNTAAGAGHGGGAMELHSGVATISNCTMTGNTSSGGGGAMLNGAATLIRGTIISQSTSGAPGNADGGGAIYNFGPLTLTNCILRDNMASGNTVGGAIRNESAGQLTLISTTVTHNTATASGGGIFESATNPGGFLTIINSTISNNVANASNASGGGIFATEGGTRVTITGSVIDHNQVPGDGGGIWSDGDINIDRSTISSNTASQFGGVRVTHIFHDPVITNSTIVNNTATSTIENPGGGLGKPACGLSCRTVSIGNTVISGNTGGDLRSGRADGSNGQDMPIVSLGYNLIGTFTQGAVYTESSTDLIGVDPQLGPLQDNGGLTKTHALLPGSPAIDQGKRLSELTTDQRSLPRPFDQSGVPNATGGDGSDIGALESQPANSRAGNNITATAPDGDASVTFATVSQAGFTTFTRIVRPSLAGIPPAGYTILDDAPGYNITTTATYTGAISVCFTVSSVNDAAEFARLRILHEEGGQLVDRTDLNSLDFASHTACAQVSSLSPFVVALAPASSRLLNISTRLRVETGDNVLIGGFIVSGTQPKKVIVRAIGPSLPLADKLANPTLELRDGSGALLASNDDWRDGGQEADIIASTVPPSSDLESAVVATLPANASGYTVIVRGVNNTTGIGLVEIYDLEPTIDSQLANISTRGFVQTGDNVMIGGFILGHGGDRRVIVRAIGPSLPVAGKLANPTLEIADQNGTILAANDDWRTGGQEAEIIATTVPPMSDLESAIVTTLPPARHTVIVRGKNGGTGVALVEAFVL